MSSIDRYHHGDLRRALIQAGAEILEEGGELSLRAVARRAGVSHAAPYHHFPDRRALLAAIAVEGFVALRDAEIAAAERVGREPVRALAETGVAYVRFAVEGPARFRMMFSAELADRTALPELEAAQREAYGVMVGEMRRTYPEATPEEIERSALGAWSIVHGLANLILEAQVGEEARTPEGAEALARAILKRTEPSPPR